MSRYQIVALVVVAPLLLLQGCAERPHAPGFVVVALEDATDRMSPESEICSSFGLTKADVSRYFSKASEMDEYDFNHEAIILPCKYKGMVRIDGDLLQWEIVAGGAGLLYDGKTVNKRFLCREECCKEFENLC